VKKRKVLHKHNHRNRRIVELLFHVVLKQSKLELNTFAKIEEKGEKLIN